MAQVTIYLPDDVARRVRRDARRAKLSVSAYLARLAAKGDEPGKWPDGFAALYGSWKGDFPGFDDPPPDDVESL